MYYRKQMLSLVDLMQSLVITELQNDTLNDALFSRGVELLARQMDRALSKLEALDINSIALMTARGFVNRLNRNNDNTFKANLRNNVGLDLKGSIEAEGLTDALKVIVSQNVALIKSVKDEYKDNIGKLLRDNVLDGNRPTNIVTQIKDIGGVTKSRAKFISRDQTAKVNADLVELRAEALGSKTYVWSSSMDERTRTSHKVMNGMLCKWSDDTVYSDDGGLTWKPRSKIGGEEYKPSKIYNCRCSALPQVSFS